MEDPQPGDVLAGRYEVEALIREGARRRTYLGRDLKMDRPVALSVAKPEAAYLDPEGAEREARVLGRIGSHDNIVSVYDYHVSSDHVLQFVVFEYLGGGTLSDVVRDEGRLRPEELLRLGRQLCRGVAHLHSRGVLHRDIAPKNVLFDERHEAHLGDFDSAIALDDPPTTLPVTTNAFASPEEIRGGPLDVRSDLYSLGATLYVAALGRQRLGPTDWLRAERPDLPSSFADLLASMLAQSPGERPPDAQAVLAWLKDIHDASNIEALISQGETQQVEFKSSLLHLYGELPLGYQNRIGQGQISKAQAEKELRKELQLEVTKTIAAFLNSEGGMLLIGVDDLGRVVGIENDFQYLEKANSDRWKTNSDRWLLFLQQLIVRDLGAEAFSAVRSSVVRHGEVTVAVVSCPRRGTETWHRGDGGDVFYIRAGNGTRRLDGRALVTYIREHWSK
jgi:serine/threonine protein kinase